MSTHRCSPSLQLWLLIVAGLITLTARAQTPITSGETLLGAISVIGESDIWTFNATAGDTLLIRVGKETNIGVFAPQLRLVGPTGTQVSQAVGVAAEIAVTAPTTGAYTIVVTDGSSAHISTGGYRLTLVQSGIPPTLTPGDQGGVLVNGSTHSGTIEIGDLDVWTLSADVGDNIVVRAGDALAGGPLTPWLRIYGPAGNLLGNGFAADAAEVTTRATVKGTFTVVIGDGSAARSGAGGYKISMTKTGEPVTVDAGDEGGPITNGLQHSGKINLGELDAWTIQAEAGQGLVVRVGRTNSTDSLLPWIRLFGPDGVQLDTQSGSSVEESIITVAKTGTILVVVADANTGRNGTGAYRLTAAKTGSPVTVSPEDEGGPLANGIEYTGVIETGDLDVWTVTAEAGDNIVVRVGDGLGANTLTPWVRIFSPSGALLKGDFGTVAAEVSTRATLSGEFLVVVGDGTPARNGTGAYRLSMAKSGSPVGVSQGDEGGELSNGFKHTGAIGTGEIDAWTITATAGENILVRMGKTTPSDTLAPYVRIFGPDGVALDSQFGTAAAEGRATVNKSGTVLVVVADSSAAQSGTGGYQLTMARTGAPVSVAPGDEGGPLTNGFTHTGTIDTGDLDVWTVNATAGDYLIARVGETGPGNALTPWVRLYSPGGALLDDGFGSGAGEAFTRATVTGTFLVVVGDGTPTRAGTGNYRLSLVKTGTPLTISAGDEGGELINGAEHKGVITVGDLDAWTFNANPGDNIVVRAGRIAASDTLAPRVGLLGPDGVLIANATGSAAAEVTAQATKGGTFTVVVSDATAAISATGEYRLTLAHAPGNSVVSAGDEGGVLLNQADQIGTIPNGDLDVWWFIACEGRPILLTASRVDAGATLVPWMRLYGRNGALLKSDFGPVASISITAPATGRYMLVVGDGTAGRNAVGTYRLSSSGILSGLGFCPPMRQGSSLVYTGAGGTPGATFTLLSAPTITTPLAAWTPISTNQFGEYGEFSFTRALDTALKQIYFRMTEP